MVNWIAHTLSTIVSHVISRIGNPAAGNTIDHLRFSLAYVKGIKSLRMFVMALAAVGAAFMLLTAGLTLFGVTVLFFTGLSMQAKMFIGFALAIMMLMAAALIFRAAFSQARWLSMFHVHDMLDERARAEEEQC